MQRAGYSDIEKKTTDFVKAMTDLDKKELIAAYMKRIEGASKKLWSRWSLCLCLRINPHVFEKNVGI